nr:hypothetical protein [[Limnothrix rosea] IAM M-220]
MSRRRIYQCELTILLLWQWQTTIAVISSAYCIYDRCMRTDYTNSDRNISTTRDIVPSFQLIDNGF